MRAAIRGNLMANQFYSADAQRAAKVHDLFARIAPRYDLINDVQSLGLHRFWKRRLVRLARMKPGETALDICCGTGDIARALAATGGRTCGLDFSSAMLNVALERNPAGNSPVAPRFLRGDAQQLPFPDESFDVVSIGYGLRNLSNWRIGLAEMKRVARPGGRVLVLDFGKPDLALWRGFYFAYLRLFVPVLGWAFCGNSAAYAYILESLKNYPAQRGVADGMRELGLANVRIIQLLGGAMSINYGEKPDHAMDAAAAAACSSRNQ